MKREKEISVISRRDVLLAFVGTSLFASRSFPELPDGIGTRPDFNGRLPRLTLGDKPARPAEEKIARAVLAKAPTGPTPFDVAQYFIEVGQGTYGDDWKPYIGGWPERWNPVIVSFFRATDTTPKGDLTPWCAAFVNWCVQRAGAGVATNNASSGSFRCFGEETTTPQLGDIVVFKQVNAGEPCIGKGHVGFFVRDAGEKIEVLGGNQIHGGHHRISSKALSKDGTILKFHSYRTSSLLHTKAE